MINPKQRQFVVDLLHNVIGKKCGPINSIKQIHYGYTNQSYVVKYANDKKYQVRLPHCGDLINRVNEYQINSLLKNNYFVYFDTKTGIAIKKWIAGKCPRISSWRKWNKIDELFSQIKKIHTLVLPKGHHFKKIDHESYGLNLYRLKLSYQAKFMSIVDTYRDDPLVLSHTDINPSNIIQDDRGKLHLIDFEWCGLASDYWDYANFIRETRISWYEKIDWGKYINNFDLQKLKDYIFACSVYAYLWAWTMPQTKKIKRYKKRVLHQISKYSKGVLNNDK